MKNKLSDLVLAYDDAEPELRPAILALAKLEHAARKAKRSPTTPRPAIT